MKQTLPSTAPIIQIAAALILDGRGRMLLVRKKGSSFFIQAGGKIEKGEAPLDALDRELKEELGVSLLRDAHYLGHFIAEAANEDGHLVEAELYRVRLYEPVTPGAEIEEFVWADEAMLTTIKLAPLTRNEVMPLARQQQP